MAKKDEAYKNTAKLLEEAFKKTGLVVQHVGGCSLEELADIESQERLLKQKLNKALHGLGYQITGFSMLEYDKRYRVDLELKRIKPCNYRKK